MNAVKLIMLMFGILGVTYIGALIIEHVEGKVKKPFLSNKHFDACISFVFTKVCL